MRYDYKNELKQLETIYRNNEQNLEDFFSSGLYDCLVGQIIQAMANQNKEVWNELAEQGYDPYELEYYDFREICRNNEIVMAEINKVFNKLETFS